MCKILEMAQYLSAIAGQKCEGIVSVVKVVGRVTTVRT